MDTTSELDQQESAAFAAWKAANPELAARLVPPRGDPNVAARELSELRQLKIDAQRWEAAHPKATLADRQRYARAVIFGNRPIARARRRRPAAPAHRTTRRSVGCARARAPDEPARPSERPRRRRG